MKDEFNEHHEEIEPPKPLYDHSVLPKRLDIHDPAFCEAMEGFLEVEVINKRNGLYKESTACSLRILIELTHIPGIDNTLARVVANYVFEWFNTKDPYLIDMAIAKCAGSNVEPPPTLIHLTTVTALDRLNDTVKKTKRKALLDREIKAEAFDVMLNLIYLGATLREASEKAAGYLESIYPDGPSFKASTLDKQYAKKFRTPDPDMGGTTEEERIFTHSQRFFSTQGKEWWEKFRETQAPASPERIGNRRS